MSYVAPIVEGHGELDAVPALLRRIAHEIAEASIQVNPPYRVNASAFLKYDLDFRKAIGISAIKAADNDGFVLILLDCDDDCPAQLGPTILAKANAERPDVPFVVCLAYREFETWFLYGARSLAGCCGLPADLQPPESPETIRDAKGWLGQKMPQGYKETSHQVSLVARLDLDAATRSESFRRLVDRLVSLLRC